MSIQGKITHLGALVSPQQIMHRPPATPWVVSSTGLSRRRPSLADGAGRFTLEGLDPVRDIIAAIASTSIAPSSTSPRRRA